MTSQQDERTELQQGGEGERVSVARRALLRGAMATVPTVMTLHSGAALARSSNLVGVGPTAGSEGGKFRCMDTETVYKTDNPNVYDLGDPPMAHVTTIRDNVKFRRVERVGHSYIYRPGAEVSPADMCREGGAFFRIDGWNSRQVAVKRGVLVSATALASFSGSIRYTDV